MLNLTEKQPDPLYGFLLVRHGQDNNVLTAELDQPLVPDSFSEISNLALDVRATFLTNFAFTIMYGPSKRASETACNLSKILFELGYTVNLEENMDIREFYQGQFRVDHSLLVNGKYIPLEHAWEIFNAKVANGEVNYEFGDPVNISGKSTFSMLHDYFIKYGETQSEFLFRIRRFVFKISNINRLANHLCVVITHQAVASRIQREITGKRFSLGYCEGVFVPYLSV